jgi:anti-sigma B factor antagonist
MAESLMITTTIDDDGHVILAVAGEVDLATAPQLAQCLTAITDRDVRVDLSAVTFLDSSGVSALVAGSRALTAGGHRLRTFGERDNVRRVLEISGLDSLFHGDEAVTDQ